MQSRFRSALTFIPMSAAFFVMFTGDAFAYVDPGSGALILQIFAAIGVGILFYFRQARQYIAGIFRKKGNEE